MLKLFLILVVLLAAALFLLCIGVMLRGRFVSSHVSANPALRRKGIHCVQQQDRESRRTNTHAVKERQSSLSCITK